VDLAFLPHVQGQPDELAVLRADVQPGKLLAGFGIAEISATLVADDAVRAADQVPPVGIQELRGPENGENSLGARREGGGR